MKKYEYLKANQIKIKEFVKNGLINVNVATQIEIYERVSNSKESKTNAFFEIARDTGFSYSTIKNIYYDLNRCF